MNLICGIEEATGLKQIAISPYFLYDIIASFIVDGHEEAIRQSRAGNNQVCILRRSTNLLCVAGETA